MSSQQITPGFSCDTAVCPRSEHPSAARTPNPRSVKFNPLRAVRPTPSSATHRISDGSTPPCKIKSSTSRPTGLSTNAVTTAVSFAKQRFSPRATLYSPPPSYTSNDLVVQIRLSPGSNRNITSPRLTKSHRTPSFAFIFSAIHSSPKPLAILTPRSPTHPAVAVVSEPTAAPPGTLSPPTQTP